MFYQSINMFRRCLLTCLIVALAIIPINVAAQTLSDTSWTEYFGSSTGPHNNWGHSARISSDRTKQIRRALDRGDSIVLGDNMGLARAGRATAVAEFMDSIEATGGDDFRQEVFYRAVELDGIRFDRGASQQDLIWSFGNEITSTKYSRNLRLWAGEPVAETQPGDPFIIPYYAEYYLAPAVEAIHEAEIATGGNFPVVLGSIGNGNNPDRRAFLHELLNYELLGSYASSLAGQRVADIVDVADIHYTIAKNTHVFDNRGKYIKHLKGSYELAFAEIYDPWVETGILDGLWSTEDVGRKVATGGYGAAKMMVVAARFLHWFSANDLSPMQGRSLIFGTTLGPSEASANLAMQTLFDFLGQTPLDEIPGKLVPPADDWETYMFESVDDVNKRVGFVLPSWSDIVENTFTNFQVDVADWPGDVSAQVHVYGVDSSSVTTASVSRLDDVLTIVVPTPIEAITQRPPSIVILLQRN